MDIYIRYSYFRFLNKTATSFIGTVYIMAMLDMINKMKGTALGVAELLTPVLKVRTLLN